MEKLLALLLSHPLVMWDLALMGAEGTLMDAILSLPLGTPFGRTAEYTTGEEEEIWGAINDMSGIRWGRC